MLGLNVNLANAISIDVRDKSKDLIVNVRYYPTQFKNEVEIAGNLMIMVSDVNVLVFNNRDKGIY